MQPACPMRPEGWAPLGLRGVRKFSPFRSRSEQWQRCLDTALPTLHVVEHQSRVPHTPARICRPPELTNRPRIPQGSTNHSTKSRQGPSSGNSHDKSRDIGETWLWSLQQCRSGCTVLWATGDGRASVRPPLKRDGLLSAKMPCALAFV